MTTAYDYMLESLSIPEASRLNRYALSRGYMILPYEHRQEELAYQPPRIIPAKDMPYLKQYSDGGVSRRTFESIRNIQITLESKGVPYTPDETPEEERAATHLRLAITFYERLPDQREQYPLRELTRAERRAFKALLRREG